MYRLSYSVSGIMGTLPPPNAAMISGRVLVCPTTRTTAPACCDVICLTSSCVFFASTMLVCSRNRPRESGEVSKDDYRAEDGEEHGKDDDGTDSRPRCGGFVHCD